ncbi:MAG: hypothetical protein ABIA97_02105 [Candidatus Omnitrophota bacterium]
MVEFINKRPRLGFVVLELLLVAVAIIIIFLIASKFYFKSSSIDKSTQESLVEHGINASSQQAVLESTQRRVKEINKQILEREKQLENYNY